MDDSIKASCLAVVASVIGDVSDSVLTSAEKDRLAYSMLDLCQGNVSVGVYRGALHVLATLLQRMQDGGVDTIHEHATMLRHSHDHLARIESDDLDEVARAHARAALSSLDVLMKSFLAPLIPRTR